MKKIIQLPTHIAQKIAAGEVIERPFSVVKELVENSLDAGASDVRAELLNGGKKLIRVTDNGCGMSRDDAEISFERHSTSKISTEEDLARIATLGFRGEALPSISAVSRVTLRTSCDGSKATLIKREGEKVLEISSIAFPRGTSIEVQDLFYNLPARKKFLRSERSELSLIVKYLIGVSLAYPGVRFLLLHGTRGVFHFPPVTNLKERIYQVYGRSVIENLMEIDFKDDSRRIYGFASRPPSGRRDRSHQLFFVNRRPVKDKIFHAALSQAYKGFLEKDLLAEAWIFCELPYSEVDVNVHPAKAEVRFQDSQTVFHLIQTGLTKAILREAGIKKVSPFLPEEKPTSWVREGVRANELNLQQGKMPWEQELLESLPGEEGLFPRVLGQYLNMYIVAAKDEELLIIDQHNAHERVLFEKYMEIHKNKRWPRKLALIPIIIELSPVQVLSLEENKELMEEAGFCVESMGGKSFAIKEFPDILKEADAKDIVHSLLEELKGSPLEEKLKTFVATLACKTAVKAGEPLPLVKMIYLVEELFKVSNLSVCPHGRPVLIKIDKKDIEKGLKRS